jgi:hypothetical protein
MASLTKRDPRYQWQNNSGVVNLLPRAGEPEFLKVRLRQYTVNADLTEALKQLMALPEIRGEAARLGLERNTLSLGGLSPGNHGPSQISLTLSNVSLHEALNALVRAHGSAIWGYREYRCNGVNQFSIEFLSR